MHNPLRSERTIVIDGKTLVLKPTFDAMARIEADLNRSIFAVLQDLSNPRTCKISEIVTVIQGGLIAGNPDAKSLPSRLQIGQHLQKVGVREVMPIIVPWLMEAVATDEDLAEQRSEKASPGEA